MRLTFTRAGIAAVAVAAVLALSSCSSSDDGTKQPTTSVAASGTGQQATPSGTPSAQPTATPTTPAESTAPGDEGAQTAAGVWLATQGTTKVQLVLGKGKAALTSTHLCGGGYTDQDGIGITLTCMDGDTERTTGHGVLAPDGKTLTVRWTDGPTDVFARTGLPSS